MMWRLRAGIGLFGFALLVGCSNASAPATDGTTGASTASVERGVHFLEATLAWDSSAPPNPGGPIMRVSGEVVSGSGSGVGAGIIKAYVLDGPPGRASYAVATIDVRDGTFAQTFRVIGPGGNEIRLDYVEGGEVLASTVVKD